MQPTEALDAIGSPQRDSNSEVADALDIMGISKPADGLHYPDIYTAPIDSRSLELESFAGRFI